MTVSLSFSGGISHSNPVSQDAQRVIAQQLARVVREAVSKFYVSGSGAVTVGTEPCSFTVTPSDTFPE